MCPRGTPLVAGIVLFLLGVSATRAEEQQRTRTELAKVGKAATALLEVGARGHGFGHGYGSAFCIHRSGLFVTNEHVIHPRDQFGLNQQSAEGQITLVANPGEKSEKSYAARVIRIDKDLDLALLRVEGGHDFPSLSLGDDDKLQELMDVVAFGFPFGAEIPGSVPWNQPAERREYPSVSVNAGSITALRHKAGNLDRIQLDATINPGNSGGPLLDKDGKVVGVVVSMAVAQRLGKTGISYAVPVSHLARFVARPEIDFDMPVIGAANVDKPVVFTAKVVSIVPPATPLSVDLILKPARGREQSYHMQAAGTNYRVTAVPLPRPPGPWRLRLQAQYDNGLLNAVAADGTFRVGERSVQLSEVRSVQFKPRPQATLLDGKVVEGPVTGLETVPVQLGDQSLAVNLAKAAEVKVAPAIETDQVWCTLLVRQGDREIVRQTDSMVIEGFLPIPVPTRESTGINRPTLEGNPAVRKLAAPLDDVVVGGGGRFLVLHLPSLNKLAVFDVNTAQVTGYIPAKDDNVRFAACRDSVVVMLPGAGTMERWSLKTLERDIVVPLPVKGPIKAVAMGSASNGPLLVHWGPASEQNMSCAFALISVETMKLAQSEVQIAAHMQHLVMSRESLHIRASANGNLFGMWCTSHSPSGVGVIAASDAGVQAYYGHWSAGYVVPSADGKWLYTRLGRCAPEVSLTNMQGPAGNAELPACQGDEYLRLPADFSRSAVPRFASPQRTAAPAKPPAEKIVTVHHLNHDRAIVTLRNLNLPGGDEDWIKHDLTFDKRVHLIPEAKVIITIPASNDRLLLYGFGG